MNELKENLQPVLELIRHHVPEEVLGNGLLAAVLVGAAGLLLAVWGAKLLRGVFVLGFLGAGIWFGSFANQWVGVGQWFCMIAGALVFGALGLVLYRLWVGVAWGALLACVGLSALGYQQAYPSWGEFRESRLSATILANQDFTPPTIAEQLRFNEPDPAQIFQDFGDHLAQNVPTIKRNAVLVGGLGAIGGLLMGLLAVRFTMVLATALSGVALLGGAVGYGLTRYRPELVEQATAKPVAVLAGLGLAVLLSVAIQWFQGSRSRKSVGAPAGVT